MEVKKCPFCGKTVLEIATVCKHCKRSLQQPSLLPVEKQAVPLIETPKQPVCRKCGAAVVVSLGVCTECGTIIEKEQPKVVQPQPISVPQPQQKKNNTGMIALIVVLAVVALSVFGGIYYYNVYIPEKIDREAPRYYSMVQTLNLRSSRDAGGDYNKIGSIPYGAELITYEHDSEWSKVKYKFSNGDVKTGFVSSAFVLDKSDFIRLNSIFGDVESKECVLTTKCRNAVLNYFKQMGFIGKVAPDVLQEAIPGFVPNDANQWQIFCRDAKLQPNNVLFARIRNQNSEFTDFAVIIKNITTNERRLLLFYFDDDETPHLLYEEPVYGQGYIVSIRARYDNVSGNTYTVRYSE